MSTTLATTARARFWTRRRWLGGVVAGGFAIGAAAQQEGVSPRVAQVPAPLDWPRLQLIDGSIVAPEQWAGAPAVVVFWATWCAFCRRHNAHIDQLFRSLGGSGPRVLGVAMDGDVAAVRRYMQANGYGFPVVLDEGKLRYRFTARRVVPMTCLVDRLGHVRQCIPGEMSESDVLALPRALAV